MIIAFFCQGLDQISVFLHRFPDCINIYIHPETAQFPHKLHHFLLRLNYIEYKKKICWKMLNVMMNMIYKFLKVRLYYPGGDHASHWLTTSLF